MRIVVDTPIWSLALRRKRARLSAAEHALVGEWSRLLQDDLAILIGPVRQEVLSGIREAAAFERLRRNLRGFVDEPLAVEDFEQAAECGNRCRAAGVAGSAIDFLLCAVALRRECPLFTTDVDFQRYAKILALRLHVAPVARS